MRGVVEREGRVLAAVLLVAGTLFLVFSLMGGVELAGLPETTEKESNNYP